MQKSPKFNFNIDGWAEPQSRFRNKLLIFLYFFLVFIIVLKESANHFQWYVLTQKVT